MTLATQDMICLPFAGGGSTFFQPWKNADCDSFRIRPVCLPGREGRIRDPLLTSMAAVLDWLEQHLGASLDRPHVLCGHSMGGSVAYALCHRRMQRGLSLPQALVVSACLPPPIRRPVLMHQLNKADLLRALLEYDQTNASLQKYPELWDLLEPVLRADFTVVETYLPAEPLRLPIPVIALSGYDDPLIHAPDMAHWSTRGHSFSHHKFAGGHFFPRDHPAEVLETIAQALAVVQKKRRSA